MRTLLLFLLATSLLCLLYIFATSHIEITFHERRSSVSSATPAVSGGAKEKEEDNGMKAEREIVEKVARIKRVCGDVCNTSISGPFDEATGVWEVTKRFDCEAIFANADLHDAPDSEDMTDPIKKLPEKLLDDFTYNRRIKIFYWYSRDEFRNPSGTYTWRKHAIDDSVNKIKAGNLALAGSYSVSDNNNVMEGLKKMNLQGKRVLVIGSITPWMESLVLANGASHVVTLEYTRIICDHPQMSSMTPDEFSQAYISSTLVPFDAMATFSSLEHAGLGRYGDGLHPWGDLVVMARVWCVTNPGAMVLFGAPASLKDEMAFNVHRCYGPVMYSHVLANFKYLWTSHPRREGTTPSGCRSFVQPVVVAQKR